MPGPLSNPTVFTVNRGEGAIAVSRRLVQEGIIADRSTFILTLRHFKLQDKLKPGDYNIKANVSLRDIVDMLVEGKAILYSITIPEGITAYQVVEKLKANPDLVGDIEEIPPEGSLLPATYPFAKGTARIELIRRMQGEQKKFLEGIWASRSKGLLLTKPEDVLNLAAIVEKETSQADERRHVAGVYLNRLRKGMLLQADPTIIYGLTHGQGPLGRPIRRSEINDRENAYNTYKHKGLPPTPIANPGRDAIIAVLNPEESADLYFVANGTGGHEFAATNEEHRRNVAKWRRFLREKHEEEEEEAEAKAPATAGLASLALDKLPVAEIPLPQRNPHR